MVINDVDENTAQQTVAAITARAATRSPRSFRGTAETPTGSYAALPTASTSRRPRRDAGILTGALNMSDDEFDAVIHTHLRDVHASARCPASARAGTRGISPYRRSPDSGNPGQTNTRPRKPARRHPHVALECAKAQITVNAIVPIALTRMLATIPGMAPHVEAAERGEPIPGRLRRLGFGTPDDVAALAVFLASDGAASATGQCIGIGGDKLSLWSHPQEVKVALHDGGWTPDLIAESWSTSIGQEPQSYGDELLKHLIP